MKKKLKVSFNAPVTLWFVTTGLFVTLLGVVSGGGITEKFFITYNSSLLNPMTYIRLLTHVLGHNGWSHYIGNAIYLLMMGPILEEKYGSKVILETIVFTALVTGIVKYIFFWKVWLYGASGVVFAFIILASFTSFNDGEIPLSFILVAGIYIGQQVCEGIAIKDNVSNLSHILGGLVGSIIGYNLNKKNKYST